MLRKLVVEFTKMNGAGNDFIVIDNRFYFFSEDELSDLATRFCPRRTGIGADGLLAFDTPADERHDFRMQYVNADGSRGTMCGNGARCLARYARLAGLTAEPLVFETDAGVYRAEVPADPGAPVRLHMNAPEDWRPDHGLEGKEPGVPGSVHYLWTGTEHAVCLVDDVRATPVASWGPAIRRDPTLGPAGANVDFVEVLDGGNTGTARLRVRTYEKGVEAETLACGTGAMAAALAARLLDRITASTVDVLMPGGTLAVRFDLSDAGVTRLSLEGPADVVYRGTLEVG